jgi:hypothetical protein
MRIPSALRVGAFVCSIGVLGGSKRRKEEMKRNGLVSHYQSQKAGRTDMPLEHIAPVIAAPIIILRIVWEPLLDFIGPPFRRFLQRRRDLQRSRAAAFPAISFGTLAE